MKKYNNVFYKSSFVILLITLVLNIIKNENYFVVITSDDKKSYIYEYNKELNIIKKKQLIVDYLTSQHKLKLKMVSFGY